MSNILHIIASLDDGGAEAILYSLCVHDTANRHHVVCLMGRGKYGPLLEAQGVTVTCLNLPRRRLTATALWRLWRLFRNSRPALVQTWMYHANLIGGAVARIAGHRNIVWGLHNSTLTPDASSRSTILVAQVCGRLSRWIPRRIICCSDKARYAHAAIGYDETRMHVIPNGFDLSVFEPNEAAGREVRRSLSLSEAERVVAFVARFDPYKDHGTLLEALALVKRRGKSLRCLLVGSGMDNGNSMLVKRIGELNLEETVILAGRRGDIPALMNALDLHIISSTEEAFGNVLAEAMACGTPCVSTDVGAAAAIVGSTGRIVPRRDPEALAGAIMDMLSERDGPAWAARREAARRHIAAHFSIQRMVEGYRRVWLG